MVRISLLSCTAAMLLAPLTAWACPVIQPSETYLADDGPCATQSGNGLTDTTGYGGHAYASMLDNPSPDYAEGMIYMMTFAQAGEYEVWVHIPTGQTNLANAAEYKVAYSGGATTKVQIDQAAQVGGWASLGVFAFEAGVGHWVRLGDNYGLASDNGKTFIMDDMRVVPAQVCACAAGANERRDCPDGNAQTRGCDGCAWGAWSTCPDAPVGICTPGASEERSCDPGSSSRGCLDTGFWGAWSECPTSLADGDDASSSIGDVGSPGDAAAAADSGGIVADATCHCRAVRASAPASSWAWLLAVGALVLVRRRRT